MASQLAPIIPVYLNQSYVFDILAMLKGGLSTVTTVTETHSAEINSTTSGGVGAGLGSVFAPLVKVDLSAKRTKSKGNGDEKTSTQERVHTPASMLHSLRQELIDASLLTTEEDALPNLPNPGQLIEVSAILKRNPVIETLDTFLELLPLVNKFGVATVGNKSAIANQKREFKEMLDQAKALRETLTQGNTIDLFAELDDKTKVIVTVDKRCLDDAQMSNLIDGHYKIIGKVSRAISSDDAPLNLLRKSSLSKIPNFMDSILQMINAVGDTGEIEVPDAIAEVNGPAVHILPIAIFV